MWSEYMCNAKTISRMMRWSPQMGASYQKTWGIAAIVPCTYIWVDIFWQSQVAIVLFKKTFRKFRPLNVSKKKSKIVACKENIKMTTWQKELIFLQISQKWVQQLIFDRYDWFSTIVHMSLLFYFSTFNLLVTMYCIFSVKYILASHLSGSLNLQINTTSLEKNDRREYCTPGITIMFMVPIAWYLSSGYDWLQWEFECCCIHWNSGSLLNYPMIWIQSIFIVIVNIYYFISIFCFILWLLLLCGRYSFFCIHNILQRPIMLKITIVRSCTICSYLDTIVHLTQ